MLWEPCVKSFLKLPHFRHWALQDKPYPSDRDKLARLSWGQPRLSDSPGAKALRISPTSEAPMNSGGVQATELHGRGGLREQTLSTHKVP
jgi:hypothetical protein